MPMSPRGARRRAARGGPAQPRALRASSICRSPAACRAAITPSRRPARRRASWSPPAIIDLAAAERLAGDGVAVISVPENRWARVDIKSVSLLPNVLAKQAAREQGAREAWFVDADGRVTEGSSSNAWIVDPRRQGRHPPGRPRASCAASPAPCCSTCIAAQGLKLEERAFTLEEAYAAREAFITSASQIVLPVVRIDGRPVGNGAPGLIASALRRDFTATPKTLIGSWLRIQRRKAPDFVQLRRQLGLARLRRAI